MGWLDSMILSRENCLYFTGERYFFQNNVVPQCLNGMVCGYVHVYKIIKQLFHACSGNSQNYCPSVLEMTWELLPSASGNSSQVLFTLSDLNLLILM
jgi:hypothetical protein